MKIHLIISSLGTGGAERVLTLMANSLSKNPNNEVSVITLFDTKDNYSLNPAVNKIEIKRFNSIPTHTIRSIVNLSNFYKKKSNRPDIIISFVTLTNLITIIVARLFKIKIIAQEHNSHLRHMKGRKLSTLLTKQYVYKKADIVTVLTSFDIPYYKKYGVNVTVLPNPCSFKAISDNTHEREKSILAVGHLDRYHHKGFDNLIKLIAPVLKKNPDWTLKIAGSGSKGLEFLSKLVEEHKLKEKVEFLGFRENISELMRLYSIFILPSRFEGLPMVLLEAMSQGMACIAYDCKTGPSDIIINNNNGLLINDQDSQSMQSKLELLLNNEKLRSELSREAINSLDRFHISTITENYENLIKKTINA